MAEVPAPLEMSPLESGSGLTQRKKPEAAAAAAGADEFVVTAPAGKLGLVIGLSDTDRAIVKMVRATSPLAGRVDIGDMVLKVDGSDTSKFDHRELTELLKARERQSARVLTLRHNPDEKYKLMKQRNDALRLKQSRARRKKWMLYPAAFAMLVFVVFLVHRMNFEATAAEVRAAVEAGG